MVIRSLSAGAGGAGAVLSALAFLLPAAASHARPLTKLDRLVFEAAPLSDDGNERSRGADIAPANGAASTDLDIRAHRRPADAHEIEKAQSSAVRYDDLMRLGRRYQQQGRHAKALAAFARARYVSKLKSGFYSVEQIDALDQSLPSLVATDQLQAADRGYGELVLLTKKHYGPDAPEVAAALEKLGDFKLDAFHRVVLGGPSPATKLVEQGTPTETQSRADAFELVKAAQSAYLEAIRLLVNHEQFHDARLHELELKLVRTFFLQAYRHNILENPLDYMPSRRLEADSIAGKPGISPYSRRFVYGEQAYMRMLSYLKRDPEATTEELGRTLVGLGDWYMLFGHRSDAVAKYRRALEILESGGASEKTIASLLRPDVPVRLPTFLAPPHAPGELDPTAPDGSIIGGATPDDYIDVHFTLDKYGRAQDIKVVGGTAAASKAVRGRLVWMLRDAQFRPVFDGDTLAENAPVSVRYSVIESDGR